MKLPRLKIADEIERRVEVINLLGMHKTRIGYFAQLLYTTINKGGRVFVGGNGGSAAMASHLASELVGRYKISRPSLDVRSLNSDGAILTAIANDFGFEYIFDHQLDGQFQKGDLAIFFTTTGDSQNIALALTKQSMRGNDTVLLAGHDGGACKGIAKVEIIIGSDETAIIQECHLILIHILCDLLERKLQQEPDSRFQYQA